MFQRPDILNLFTDMQRANTIVAINNPVIKPPTGAACVKPEDPADTGLLIQDAYTP